MFKVLRNRGTVLVTALFVVMILHALVTVIVGSLRADSGALRATDREIEASVKARSAALYALDVLESSDGTSWEGNHTVSGSTASIPPAEADTVTATLADGSELSVSCWVQETSDPKIRTVWGACSDGKGWQTSTAVAVRRPLNPGMLFGVNAGRVAPADRVFFSPANVVTNWTQSPPIPGPNNYIFDSAADENGHFFVVVASSRLGAGVKSLRNPRIYMLDTNSGSNGTWTRLADLPSGFAVDPIGFATGGNRLFLAGKFSASSPSIIYEMTTPDQASAVWAPVGRLPKSTKVELDGSKSHPLASFQFSSLQADQEGTLYAQLQFQDSGGGSNPETTFCRYKSGQWSFFPKPKSLSGVTRRGLLPIQVDDLGNVLTFGLPNDAEPGRVYRFSDSGLVKDEIVQGTWKPIPRSDGLSFFAEQDIAALQVDTTGHMFFGLVDTSNSGHSIRKVIQHPLRASQSAAVKEIGLPSEGLQFIKTGGQGPTDRFQYVPVGWY